MSRENRIRCNNIDYRKGFVEVESGVHVGCITLETWNVKMDLDISNLDLSDEAIPEDSVTGNTEIEMSVTEAEQLIQLLQNAIDLVRKGNV
ncbi:MAG: hypothetical protein HY272_03720 [Gammaproteobacteria bacterium]|nr:hypothetical protein [Gammaproteobacteria bacterium]